MLCDPAAFLGRAHWKKFDHPDSEGSHILSVSPFPVRCGPLPGQGPGFSVFQAFCLCPGEGFLFDEDSLPLIALPCPTEPDDNGPESGVLPRPASEGCIATGKKNQVIEVGARHAQGLVILQAEETALFKIFPALGTSGITDEPEDDELLAFSGVVRGRHGAPPGQTNQSIDLTGPSAGDGDMREKLSVALGSACYSMPGTSGLRPIYHWWHVPVC